MALFVSSSGSVDSLSSYFQHVEHRHDLETPPYTDAQIEEIRNRLAYSHPSWSNVPRTYIVLRVIGQLDLLDGLIDDGFSDHWFPVKPGSLPGRVSPDIRARFVEAQRLVLTQSIDLEKGAQGEHQHFASTDLQVFESQGVLGTGHFGQVDRVFSRISFKEYARKRVLRRTLFNRPNRKELEHFLGELTIMKKLEHRHIVKFVGSYTDPKYFGILSSPIADMDLAAYMDDNQVPRSTGKLSTLRTFFGCLANALKYLHESGVRHKDLKPQNLLVKGDSILITDFGFSRDFVNEIGSTSSGPTKWTRRYSAPEVAAQTARSWSADVWSLGCVFLEMLAVLKGWTVSQVHEYYMSHGTEGAFPYANAEATTSLLNNWATTSTDTLPATWIEQALQDDRKSRPTAQTLATTITELSVDPDTPIYCGICCRDTISDTESVDDFATVLGELSKSGASHTSTVRESQHPDTGSSMPIETGQSRLSEHQMRPETPLQTIESDTTDTPSIFQPEPPRLLDLFANSITPPFPYNPEFQKAFESQPQLNDSGEPVSDVAFDLPEHRGVEDNDNYDSQPSKPFAERELELTPPTPDEAYRHSGLSLTESLDTHRPDHTDYDFSVQPSRDQQAGAETGWSSVYQQSSGYRPTQLGSVEESEELERSVAQKFVEPLQGYEYGSQMYWGTTSQILSEHRPTRLEDIPEEEVESVVKSKELGWNEARKFAEPLQDYEYGSPLYWDSTAEMLSKHRPTRLEDIPEEGVESDQADTLAHRAEMAIQRMSEYAKHLDISEEIIRKALDPPAVGDIPSADATSTDEALKKRPNVFKRALKGLGWKSDDELVKIESMLTQLVSEVEGLKILQATHQIQDIQPEHYPHEHTAYEADHDWAETTDLRDSEPGFMDESVHLAGTSETLKSDGQGNPLEALQYRYEAGTILTEIPEEGAGDESARHDSSETMGLRRPKGTSLQLRDRYRQGSTELQKHLASNEVVSTAIAEQEVLKPEAELVLLQSTPDQKDLRRTRQRASHSRSDRRAAVSGVEHKHTTEKRRTSTIGLINESTSDRHSEERASETTGIPDRHVFGSSKSSINNPKLLATVEDAIKRLIMPELAALKAEQKISRKQVDSSRKIHSSVVLGHDVDDGTPVGVSQTNDSGEAQLSTLDGRNREKYYDRYEKRKVRSRESEQSQRPALMTSMDAEGRRVERTRRHRDKSKKSKRSVTRQQDGNVEPKDSGNIDSSKSKPAERSSGDHWKPLLQSNRDNNITAGPPDVDFGRKPNIVRQPTADSLDSDIGEAWSTVANVGNNNIPEMNETVSKTHYSIPEDGSPITINTKKHKRSKSDQTSDQTSLLIEYFEKATKEDGSTKSKSRPSVRVKVTPSDRKGKTDLSEAIRDLSTNLPLPVTSGTRRIPLGRPRSEGSETQQSSGPLKIDTDEHSSNVVPEDTQFREARKNSTFTNSFLDLENSMESDSNSNPNPYLDEYPASLSAIEPGESAHSRRKKDRATMSTINGSEVRAQYQDSPPLSHPIVPRKPLSGGREHAGTDENAPSIPVKVKVHEDGYHVTLRRLSEEEAAAARKQRRESER